MYAVPTVLRVSPIHLPAQSYQEGVGSVGDQILGELCVCVRVCVCVCVRVFAVWYVSHCIQSVNTDWIHLNTLYGEFCLTEPLCNVIRE